MKLGECSKIDDANYSEVVGGSANFHLFHEKARPDCHIGIQYHEIIAFKNYCQ